MNSVEAILTRNKDNNIVLKFSFETQTVDLNLESNNSDEIKTVFIELAKNLRKTPLKINLSLDEEKVDNKEDALFIDATTQYVEQLNNELLAIENDSDLKKIREKK